MGAPEVVEAVLSPWVGVLAGGVRAGADSLTVLGVRVVLMS